MVSTPHRPPQPVTLQTLHDRVSWIESQLKHVATKAWVLGGVVGGMVAAAGIATGIALIVVRLAGS